MPTLILSLLALLSAPFDWSYGPVLPAARTCRATAAVGNSIVTVGGTSWEQVDGRLVKRWSREVFALNTRAGIWTRLPDYPREVGYAFAAAVNGRIYVIGGRGRERGNSEVFSLDPSEAKVVWRTQAKLPNPHWGLSGGVIGSVIYVAGGNQGPGSPDRHTAPSRMILAYDTEAANPAWRLVGTLPANGAEWQMGAAAAGRIYWFGGLRSAPGESDKDLMPLVESTVFDPKSGTCRQIAKLPHGLGSGAAVALDARTIVIAGGLALAVDGKATPNGKARAHVSSEILLYDTVQDRYSNGGSMRLGLTDQGLVFVNGRLYAIGGEDSPYRSRTDLVQVGRPQFTGHKSERQK